MGWPLPHPAPTALRNSRKRRTRDRAGRIDFVPRWYSFRLSGDATGVWLPSTDVLPLERRLLLALVRQCWFCGKDRTLASSISGTLEGTGKICNECVTAAADAMAKRAHEMPHEP